MTYIEEFISIFWNISVEMAPWLLLGFFFSGIFHAFVPMDYTMRHLGKNNFVSVLKAVLIGIPLPLCSCGVIPTSISLYKNGASKAATNAFLISTPQTGKDSFMATYALMGLPFAIIRPIFAIISGIFGGLLGMIFFKKNTIDSNYIIENQIDNKLTLKQKIIKSFEYGFITMVSDLWKWLVMGIIIATLITLLVPDDFYNEYIGNFWIETAIVLLLSIPLYVCATGSIPIALSLILKGFSPGTALLLLMIGPATNITTFSMIYHALGKKFVLVYLFSVIISSLFFAWFINAFFDKKWLISSINFSKITMNHTSIISIICTIILFCLIFYSIYLLYINANKKSNMAYNKILNVEGMTCNHCKLNVEKNLKNITGITNVNADFQNNSVEIEGNANWDEVIKTISELGYSVKD